MTSHSASSKGAEVVQPQRGPITLLAARSAGFQVNDMPDQHGANERDTLDQGSGDSDTI